MKKVLSALDKYLAHYAERDLDPHLANTSNRVFKAALVVPAYGEASLRPLADFCQQNDSLLVLVLNVPEGSDAELRAKTNNNLILQNHPNCLLVDRIDPPLPARQGVGLARKIGNDLAATLIRQGTVESPWLYQTDADTTLPENYFSVDLGSRGTALFPHHHLAQGQMRQAIDLYDAHMRYYADGLKSAGSKYGYVSLGSTLAIHVTAYAQVRGFPKRNAGEDFHMLNKLAKVAPIRQLTSPDVRIIARQSTRVPFGTGPTLAKICALLAEDPSGYGYLSYHPDIFTRLKELLVKLSAFANKPGKAIADQIGRELAALGWNKVCRRFADQYERPDQRQKTIDDWFDALKTLRYVHLLQTFPEFADQPLLATLSDVK